jgi:galactose-1-phosphate uridylyltransferase
MMRRKDAIVNGVVAVTNKEVESVKQAANTVEKPVDATMGEKTCPMCAENVKAAAKKCRFCGHLFELSGHRPAEGARVTPQSTPVSLNLYTHISPQ